MAMKHIRDCKTHDLVRLRDGKIGVVCKRKDKFGDPMVLVGQDYLLVRGMVEVVKPARR